MEYYILERVLMGTVSRKSIHYYALSGGGGGGITTMFPKEFVNNPYLKARKHVHGGPIPPGWYWIKHATATDTAKHGPCVRLEPMRSAHMLHRNGFLIHGQGPHGSDGCIVPMIPRAELKSFVNSLDADGGGTLYVDESIEGYRLA